ncbi:hypothetical protein Cgig2_027004 [Carnegiea gigantea]|uniref:Uncharacterized protein n=1 Tax=Carnegiea gigantea TaxID=171969 RepID=A0A9Q1Q8E4_9CARY|nr:hypothetical protein Cgig2_027004 [Carnegiea gigantea]
MVRKPQRKSNKQGQNAPRGNSGHGNVGESLGIEQDSDRGVQQGRPLQTQRIRTRLSKSRVMNPNPDVNRTTSRKKGVCQDEFKKHVRTHKPQLVALLESHLSGERAEECTSVKADLKAALCGLKMARDLGLKMIWLRADIMIMVGMLRGNSS